ncbi:hypothetical protein BD309DRAFT_992411 [Dichomitus squalens]|uniref:Uncharacterized protein n=1 Tax=Dichomitus squalens TaxID=114155 RepID=A0A4Q9NKG9_9APHY|nr:hypothetical protein BD309DRAFT_992411 [Dichomitus squalens]TBU59762.1 hypothetical protein BD310DRAFT_924133 [Dichomitus squalens]
MPELATIKAIASGPYHDSPCGDLIIRTADGTEFHVDRKSIADASPLFSDLFYLPQTSSDTSDKPILDVAESTAVWERIMHICTHPPEPVIDFAQLSSLLAAGKKYSLRGVSQRMQDVLLRADYLDKKPLSVYALACAYDLPAVARVAARRMLKLPAMLESVPELTSISGRAYHNLLEYRYKCGQAASTAVARSRGLQPMPGWVDEETIKMLVICSSTSDDCKENSVYYCVHPTEYYLRQSWLDYLDKLGRELVVRPDGSLASSPEMLEPVVVSAAECIACATKIFGQAIGFAKKVEEVIEDAISKVELASDA